MRVGFARPGFVPGPFVTSLRGPGSGPGRILLCALAILAAAQPISADSAGERELLALETCLFENQSSPMNCRSIPYYTCMGTQMREAANPRLARERCLFQEIFTWDVVTHIACDEIADLLPDDVDGAVVTECADHYSTPDPLAPLVRLGAYDVGFPDFSLEMTAEATMLTAARALRYAKLLREQE